MISLERDKGIPPSIPIMLAIMAGVSVSNLFLESVITNEVGNRMESEK